MKREILTPRGLRVQIERVLGYTQPTIIKALRGDYNEDNPGERRRAERIRRYALNNGGVEMS